MNKQRSKKFLNSWNLLILIILLVAFVLRIYRIDVLLDFHYDQGRDAKIIWDLWHNGKFFLIGPTTGLEGIFLGPFYYYLIAPFYLLGGGNPVIPSMFLSLLTVLALFVLYKTGELIKDKKLGLLALIIGSFSHYIVFSNRWLSNPTPIFLTSILFFYSLVKILKSSKSEPWWYLSYLSVGISLHFEAASAVFYIPVLFVFTFWQREKITNKYFVKSLALLFLTFLPQIIFNFKHQNILFNNFVNQLGGSTNQKSLSINFFKDRLQVFWSVFYSKLFMYNQLIAAFFGSLSVFGIYKSYANTKEKHLIKLFLLFLGLPLICYLLYRGNNGTLYGYYFSGYYLVIILLFSYGLYWYSSKIIGKIVIWIFVILFLFFNTKRNYLKLRTDPFASNEIFISNQLSAISWIYQNSRGKEFNVDVYVPPVIPHSYDYLFLWYESKLDSSKVTRKDNNVEILYTLYEVDPPHPERLEAWIERQKGLGIVEEEADFGGITVQRRKRISDGQ